MRDTTIIKKFTEHKQLRAGINVQPSGREMLWMIEFALMIKRYCKTYKDVLQVMKLVFPEFTRFEMLERPNPNSELKDYPVPAMGLYDAEGRQVWALQEDYLK